MKLYDRKTQKLIFQSLPRYMKEAFAKLQKRKKQEGFHLEIESNTEVYHTISVEIKKGFLTKLLGGKKKTVQVAALLLDNFLVLIISSDEKTAHTLLYTYKDISIKNYIPPQIKMMPPIEDFGLEILGFREGSTEKETYFIGVSEDQIGTEFTDLLKNKTSQ